MKALTLHQPYASLIAHGVKTIETRSWKPPRSLFGERIAIHAGKTDIDEDPVLSSHIDSIENVLVRDVFQHTALPLGRVVATARLKNAGQVVAYDFGERPVVKLELSTIVRSEEGEKGITDLISVEACPFGNFAVGRWLWFFDRTFLLSPPVSARGKQGLWNWDPPW